MIVKTRHLQNRNVWIFPRVMPMGCLHLPSSSVNVLANGQRGSLSSPFLTTNVCNESAFFVQRAHPYRAFLRNHIRTNFRVFLRPLRCLEFLHFLQLSPFLYLPEFPTTLKVPTWPRISYGSHTLLKSDSSPIALALIQE